MSFPQQLHIFDLPLPFRMLLLVVVSRNRTNHALVSWQSMCSIHHVQKVPECCRCPKRLHSLWSHLSGDFIVDVVNVVVSLWVVNVATLPSYCLFVATLPSYCLFVVSELLHGLLLFL